MGQSYRAPFRSGMKDPANPMPLVARRAKISIHLPLWDVPIELFRIVAQSVALLSSVS